MSQKKLNLNGLYLEVTRRCNMDCDHCMRGDAQNKDLDIQTLRPFFQTIETIETIGFTGGEPECSGIALSKDEFHDDIPEINEYKLCSLSFFRTHKMFHYLEHRQSIIDKGHASERLSIYKLRPHSCDNLYVTVSDDTIDLYDNNLLITVNKNILPDCDYAYDEEDELAIGRADQPEAFLDYLLEQAENESA